MGDGGFWHNGLTSGVGNAVFNQHDGVIVVVDNYYSAATGGQDIPSSRADNRSRSTKHPIVEAVKGVGAKWVRQIDHTYDVSHMRDTLREALTTKEKGPKIIVASSECMLNKQRRVKPLVAAAAKRGERVVRERFGVDEDTCSGDHACIRLSGCPSLSVKPTSDPFEGQSGRGGRQYLRRLRPLRRGRRCRRAVSFLLSRRHRFQSQRLRSSARPHLAACDRRPAALAGGTADHVPVGGGMNVSIAPSSIALSQARPITVAVLAMGGQGGGVLVDWIVALAERRGWFAQSTSVPGVAQRTGATIYYIEMIAPDAGKPELYPVLSLMPAPGKVDIVIGAELMEAGRAILRGLVSPDRTLLIGSSHRSLAVVEKTAPGDGTADASRSMRRPTSQPTASLRSTWPRSRTPPVAWFPRCCSARSLAPAPCPSRQRILKPRSARRASAWTPACAPSPSAANGPSPRSIRIQRSSLQRNRRSPTLSAPRTDRLCRLRRAGRAGAAVAGRLHGIVAAGLQRVVDYQDVAYGREYLDRLETMPRDATGLMQAFAKYLAIAMAYDDVIRVADLKTRAGRFDRVRREARAGDDQVLAITEFFHPRIEEMAGLLPPRLGEKIERNERLGKLIDRGRKLRTTAPSAFLMLYFVAGLRRFRRRTLRHAREMRHLDAWSQRVRKFAASDTALATAVSRPAVSSPAILTRIPAANRNSTRSCRCPSAWPAGPMPPNGCSG